MAADRKRDAQSLVSVDVARALDCVRSGGLVAVPTETVYGLGADASNGDAVARVFAVKGRPADHPLIVHLASAADLGDWAVDIPPAAAALADACWPGPLTMLLPRSARVSDAVTGGRPTVGLRVPAHPVALELLARFGGGIAAPSANRFGRVSPTSARHVFDDLGGFLDPARDVILDGGPCAVGVESTIVDCTTESPQVLRPGAISASDVEAITGLAVAATSGPSRAAGMLSSHYAPRASVVLVGDEATSSATASTSSLSSTAAESMAEIVAAGGRPVLIDRRDDLVAFARYLYAALREADAAGATHVVAVLPPAEGIGYAIRDRLVKAAGTPTAP